MEVNSNYILQGIARVQLKTMFPHGREERFGGFKGYIRDSKELECYKGHKWIYRPILYLSLFYQF
jgi:hypothetical protein